MFSKVSDPGLCDIFSKQYYVIRWFVMFELCGWKWLDLNIDNLFPYLKYFMLDFFSLDPKKRVYKTDKSLID